LTFLLHTNPRPNYRYYIMIVRRGRTWWLYIVSCSRNISTVYLSHHITRAGGGGRNRKFRISCRLRRAGAHSYGTSFGRRRRRRRTRERYTQAPSPPMSPPTTVAAASAAWVRPGSRPKWYILSSMEKRSMDRRKQWPTRVLTATVAFFPLANALHIIIIYLQNTFFSFARFGVTIKY